MLLFYIMGLLTFLPVSLCVKDQVAEAITVYKNPDFFGPLNSEVNNQFSSEDSRNYKVPQERYHTSDTPSYYEEDTDDHPHNYEAYEPERQRYPPYEEEGEEHFEKHPESEGGGFNTYDEAVHEGPSHGVHEDHRSNQLDEPTMFKFPIRDEHEEEYAVHETYKYPGEPKKPNPPARPDVNVHFDGNPTFRPPTRDIPRKNQPGKKGRGPYGHPKQKYPPKQYSKDFEDGRQKSHQQQLKEIEEKYRKQNSDEYQVRRPQEELQIHHDGQSFPIEFDDSREQQYSSKGPYHTHQREEEYSPKGPYHSSHPTNHPGMKPYSPVHKPSDYQKFEASQAELYIPIVPKENNHVELIDELKGSKKGTREYLRHRKRPSKHFHYHPHHHHHHHHYPSHHKLSHYHSIPHKHHHHVPCKLRHKKSKKYVGYRVRPLYSAYKVVPVALNIKPLYAAPVTKKYIPIFKRSSKLKNPRPLNDDSAYDINSEKDAEFEKLNHIKRTY